MEVENGDATNGDNLLAESSPAVEDEPEESEGDTEDDDSDEEDDKEKEPTETKKTKSKKKGKKPKSSTSLKNKKKQKKGKDKKKSKKKEKEKKEKKKKKKGESKSNLQDEPGNATTTEIEKRGTKNDDGSNTPSKASSATYDDTVNRISMKSLRKMEKARQSREGPKSFDTEDDGLWVGTTEESRTSDEKSKIESRRITSAYKDDKADWQASVTADDSERPYDSDADDDYRDFSNRSSRSHRASGRSYRSSGGSLIRSGGYGFKSLKEDRNSSLHRSIIGEDENRDSDKTEPKRKSQMELRLDLEAQARERVEKSSRKHETGAILAAFKKFTEKSRKRMSAMFETSGIQDVDLGSDAEEDDSAEKRGSEENDQQDLKKKKTLGEKWRALKRKARSRKGYIVIVSVLLAIAVIVAITLIALLAS